MPKTPGTPPFWCIPLRRFWAELDGVTRGDVPIVEKTSGLMAVVVKHRRNAPYTLATARQIVTAHNKAVNTARKRNDPEKT